MTDQPKLPPERSMAQSDLAAMKEVLMEELLAAPKPTLRERLPRPRMIWVGAATATAAAILVAVALVPSGGNEASTSILERASAALDRPGKIWHVSLIEGK